MGVPTWRQAAAADAPAIAALHAASWRTAYSAALSPAYLAGDIVAERLNFWAGRLAAPDRGSYIVLAEQDDRLLGFACAVAEGGATYGMKGAGLLDNLHVAQAFQGQGLGRRLLLEAAAWCHAVAHTDGLVLSVLQANRQAQRFYERQGAMRMGSLVWNAPDGAAVPCFLMGWTGPAWAALASLASRRPAGLSAVPDSSGGINRA